MGNWERETAPGVAGYWNGYAHGNARRILERRAGEAIWHGGYGGYLGSALVCDANRLGFWVRGAVGSIMYSVRLRGLLEPPITLARGNLVSLLGLFPQPITVINQQPDISAAAIDFVPSIDSQSPRPRPRFRKGTSHMDQARATPSRKAIMPRRHVKSIWRSKALPNDAVLHEFSALFFLFFFFATRNYAQAASTSVRGSFQRDQGWDWTTLSGMYASSFDVYRISFVKLEQYVRMHPGAADARLWSLAYHYPLTCGLQ